MSTQLDDIQNEVKKINTLLSGSYGRKGLVQEHQDIKEIVYKNREGLSRLKWIGAIGMGFLLALNAIKEFFK